jgi:2-polyprenyl-3-methyl-5-hydroxy-6-metoxy-1,4-benzoquinol methylase
MEILTECPICQSKDISQKYTLLDHSISKETFNVYECKNCNFQFTNPRPDKNNIAFYYASENYISHSNKIVRPMDYLYKTARYFMLRKKRKIIEKYTKKGDLLDIGCGTAHFLNHCKKKGWLVYGIETDEVTRNKSIINTKIDIYDSLDKIDHKKKFNAITLWHVLEHIHDVDITLTKIFEKLNNNGTLFIAVPNRESHDAVYYSEFWAAYDVPRHLYHFNHNNLINLLKKYKLNITDILPMPLDAYYVSILSHSYKFGNKSYMKALYRGYTSNKKAIKNNNNFSSSIYVFKK